MSELKRCKWTNLKNPTYIKYHDSEWGRPIKDDDKLFEMLVLESFQAGLSWECVLNKRQNLKEAFDNFDVDKISKYDNDKIEELLSKENIIKNKRKIVAMVKNAQIYKDIQTERGSFSNYIWDFTNGKTLIEIDKSESELSDKISRDLKNRGMSFVGSKIIYSYLQAIGIIYSHEKDCYLYKCV